VTHVAAFLVVPALSLLHHDAGSASAKHCAFLVVDRMLCSAP
jgi:hypothetical protein